MILTDPQIWTLAQFPAFVAFLPVAQSHQNICSHRLKYLLLVLQCLVYCCGRNRIQLSSNYVLLSTEQIPRAFYWISLPGTRQITQGDENYCKVQEERKFHNK